MVNDGIALRTTRTGQDTASRVLEFAFAAFLLLVFVGLQPFAIRDPNILAHGDMISAGEGDLARQILYLLCFTIVFVIAVQRGGWRAIDAVPPVLVLLLLWCGLSAFWTEAPAMITIRLIQ